MPVFLNSEDEAIVGAGNGAGVGVGVEDVCANTMLVKDSAEISIDTIFFICPVYAVCFETTFASVYHGFYSVY